MRYVLVGGTGTLGNALMRKLYGWHNTQVTVFSRDELKQKEMSKEFPEATYEVGDILDPYAVGRVIHLADVVFHLAALKHVDIMERHPEQSMRTNIDGTVNVARACIAADVPHMVYSSTDKAVLPINVYGMSKAISERYLFDMNRRQGGTKFGVFRWGNVVGSRGSAIPFFIESLKAGLPVIVTNKQMTRFWINIDTAAAFMLEHYRDAEKDSPCIPPMKAAPILTVIDVLAELLDVKYEIKVIGIREGEKIHECLMSTHEICLRSDNCHQLDRDELRALLWPVVEALA